MQDHSSFLGALSAAGINPAKPLDVVADGKIHRFDVDGRPAGKRHGWFVLHADGPDTWGAFGDWKTGQSESWSLRQPKQLNEAERQALVANMERVRQQVKAEAEVMAAKARAKAVKMWEAGKPVAADHPYIRAKGIRPIGATQLKDMLMVPLYRGGDLVSLQVIRPDGSKTFLSGGRTGGAFTMLGRIETDKPVLICEGWATGCTLCQATGLPVAVAFNAGNLLPVAKALRQQYPDAALILCADDDWKTEGNPGLTKATEAASAVGGLMVVPVFEGERQPKESDWNDLASRAGLDAVRQQVGEAMSQKNEAVSGCVTQSESNLPEEVTFRNFYHDKAVDNDFGNASSSTKEFDEELFIEELAKLSLLEYGRVRKQAAEQLGVSVGILDKVVGVERKAGAAQEGGSGGVIIFDDVEPWPSDVNGAAVLDAAYVLLRDYIIADPATLRAAALWSAMTWFSEYATVLPLAVITAPEKGCGKSTLLQAIAKLSCRPLYASNITPAALFRAVEAWKPSLMIDEADTFAKENEELRGIINSGHTRETAIIVRTVEVAGEHQPRAFSTWGPKAMAGIGKMPETVMSRSVVLTMRRKMAGERASNIRHADREAFNMVKRQFARWADDMGETFGKARPHMDGLSNRAADNWEPLFALADLAGGDWPKQARIAARHLSGDEQEAPSINEELLHDIREAFAAAKTETMFSAELLEHLCNDDEGAWATYNRGKPITPRQLARRLDEFGIKSRTVRKGHDTKKGYELAWFKDAFARYLDGTPVTSVTASQPSNGAASGAIAIRHNLSEKTPSVTRKPAPVLGCDAVTDKKTQDGQKLNMEVF